MANIDHFTDKQLSTTYHVLEAMLEVEADPDLIVALRQTVSVTQDHIGRRKDEALRDKLAREIYTDVVGGGEYDRLVPSIRMIWLDRADKYMELVRDND